MPKRLILPCLLACLLLCSCGSLLKKQPLASPLTNHSGNYESVAKITYKELEASAKISQATPKSCSVLFESPPSLQDMAFVFSQEGVDLNYKGLSYRFDPRTVPGSAVAKLAVSAINTAMKDDDMQISMVDSALQIAGTMQTGSFVLRLDPDSGNLIKLSVPEEELEIEFVNFRFLD